MTDLNDDQGLDNQQYYEQILRYLEDPTQENINTSWVKIQAANYFVCFFSVKYFLNNCHNNIF
jgi:hypothetical protein